MSIKSVSTGFLTVLLLPIGLTASTLALLLIPFLLITMPVITLGVAGKASRWLVETLFEWKHPNNAPLAYSQAWPLLILQALCTVLFYPFALIFSLAVVVCLVPLAFPALAGVVAYEIAETLLKDCFNTPPQKVGEEQPLLSVVVNPSKNKRTVYEEEPLSLSTYGTFFKDNQLPEEPDYSYEKEVIEGQLYEKEHR